MNNGSALNTNPSQTQTGNNNAAIAFAGTTGTVTMRFNNIDMDHMLTGSIGSTATGAPPAARPGNPVPSPELRAAIGKLQLPGLKINAEKWSVDVESTVCLDDGPLELIACTKDGEVHESIVAVAAKPSHIHAALLLLGTKPGSPATRKPIDPEGLGFIDIPPHGGPVEVSLVTRNDDGTESTPIPTHRPLPLEPSLTGPMLPPGRNRAGMLIVLRSALPFRAASTQRITRRTMSR